MKVKTCLKCKNEFEGRRNKKFCSVSCKNDYHNEQYRNENGVVLDINKVLNKNRLILRNLFKIYRSSNVPLNILEAHGYNMKFHTHMFDSPSGTRYTMVYELGFKSTFDNHINIVELQETV